jgi:hypothetical protein
MEKRFCVVKDGTVTRVFFATSDFTKEDGFISIDGDLLEISEQDFVSQGFVFDGSSFAPSEENTRKEATEVRLVRDKLLSESDWVIVRSYERNENTPLKWEAYRQALRDITTQAGFPYTVNWPTKP